MKKNLLTLLLALFAIATTAQAQVYVPGERVSTIQENTKYFIFNTAYTPGAYSDRWGFVYFDGSVKTYSGAVPESFTTSDANYLFTFTNNGDNTYTLNSVGQDSEVGNTFTLTPWMDAEDRGDAQVRNDDGTFTPNDEISEADKVWTIYNGDAYWNGNNWYGIGTNSFALWSDAHPYAIYTAIEKNQAEGLLLNAENFPDAYFRAALASRLGISEGDEITDEMIAATTELLVSGRSIADLTGIEHFTALKVLVCHYSQLTALDVSGCTMLEHLQCEVNQIKGAAMDALVASLPTVESGNILVIDTKNKNEGNVCTKSQVAVAKGKGWTVYDMNGGSAQEYEGSDDAAAGLLLNATNFPDANFRAALAEILKIGEGDEITEAKIAATTSLNVASKQIADLTGIEHFTALETLNCYRNQLTSLNVSKNTALTWLRCDYNRLTSLDVSKNTALTELSCGSNQLTSLDVSKNTALTSLYCDRNQLTSLNVSKNTALTWLRCDYNQLTSLDVSKNTALTTLYCYYNQLTSLDVSKNTALKSLVCYRNQLTALDVSKNTALTELVCFRNQIKGEAMDALVASLPTVQSGKFYVIDTTDENEGNVCTKSQVAVAKEKGWTVYDFNGSSSNKQEYEGSDDAAAALLLNAANFPDANFRAALASKLKINEGDEITEEMIAATTSIDVNGYDKTANEKIADLTGIEHFTALTELICIYNQLTSLDVSKNTALTELDCSGNQLTSLDVSKNTALTYLGCFGNQLTSLDVSKNTKLINLYCFNNPLTSLDVSKNTALTRLYCHNSPLTSLDVSKNTALTELSCGDNQLTSLDVSKNTALTELWCYGNQLTSLDVSKNTALKDLRCSNNQLTSLDVSKNTALTYLECYSNQIKGEEMDALVESLPTVSKGYFFVIDTTDENEGNVCTKSQVAVAKEKGWTVYDYNGWDEIEYEGSEDPEQEIDPVDEYDNIDYGNDMDENSDLDGNVIGDIFYNISSGNGEYNSEEGCIVVTKPTDDGTVSDLEGKDIFGEDFKSQFTGIVFKVPAGKGTIKVDAETTGNMLLKVKIGSNDPVEMELNGKLKVTFPYNVSEPTYVYIYAGAANEAKGFGKASATDAALKIYGIEFLRDDTPTDIDRPTPDPSLNGGESWYTIDGVKLNGEPTKKGIYIRNGKKVVK